MTFWPVRGWAGRGHTRSSTCSSTGKLRCFMHQCTATCCKQKHRSFLYLNACRTNTVKVTDRYQYPDNMPGDEDAFSREPFVVRFKAPKTCEGFFLWFFFDIYYHIPFLFSILPYFFLCLFPAIQEFVLIPQHTTPTNATKELDALYDVLQNVRRMWRTEVKANADHCRRTV